MRTQSSFITCCVIAILMNLSCAIHAQKNPMKFGKIEPEYFALESCAWDSTAEALILGDYGEAKITYDQFDGFMVKCSRHFRVKIFSKTGYDWASSSIVLYNFEDQHEAITLLKGRVYNMENGKVVESNLDRSMIHEEVIDRKLTEHKFTLPNVREGSILEYVLEYKSNLFDLPDWDFQYTIPALWSDYRVAYPEYFIYKMLQKGFLTFSTKESTVNPITLTFTNIDRAEPTGGHGSISWDKLEYKEQNHRWVISNVNAFKEEPFMNATSNYVTSMEFELAQFEPPFGVVKNFTRTWEGINKELLEYEDFGVQLKRGGFLKDVVTQIKTSQTNPEKQMIMAYEMVRDNMKWNELNRLYVTQSLQKAWEKKSGNSSDINLLLVTLLKELGIEAEPVIISTRSNGMVHPAQIMLDQFNYVIALAYLGDKTFLMDATEKTCPHNVLMPRCINGRGRIISGTRGDWIDLNSTQRYEYTGMTTASIGEDGIIRGKINRSYGNYAALQKRIEIRSKKDQEDYISDLEDAHKGLTIKSLTANDLDSLKKAYSENLEVEIADAATMVGNLVTFNPMLYSQWSDNPFKLETRVFPVDFIYPRIYKDIVTLQLPEGYTVDEKPQDMAIALPDGKGKFIFRLAVIGNKVQIMSTLDISRALYTTEDYILLKEFYSKLVQKHAEKVVLKKI